MGTGTRTVCYLLLPAPFSPSCMPTLGIPVFSDFGSLGVLVGGWMAVGTGCVLCDVCQRGVIGVGGAGVGHRIGGVVLRATRDVYAT